MEDFILAPTTAIDVNISISDVERPYLQQWYNETKQSGETLNQFVVRKLLTQALIYRGGKLTDTLHQEVRNYIQTTFGLGSIL